MFNLILAIDKNGLVGDSQAKFGLPWHYPEDLKFYKKMTTGKNCVMGRSTYQAIGSALPNRQTYVLTTNKQYDLEDATVINSLEILQPDQEWWICGGVSVFKQMMSQADNIYITRIDAEHSGDVYFSDIDLSGYQLISSEIGQDSRLVFEKWIKNDN